jgi:hypothetical protein
LLSGKQGIGKDMILTPVREAVGNANTKEIGPDEIFDSKFNPYVKSVLLVINEARPHEKEHYASTFYNKIKPYLAAPPSWLAVNNKHEKVTYIPNVCHVVLTTNHVLTVHIPEEDRRLCVLHSVAKSASERTAEENKVYQEFWDWLRDGGWEAAARWLLRRDLSKADFSIAPETEGRKRVKTSTVRRTSDTVDGLLDDYFDLLYETRMPEVVFLADLTQFEAHRMTTQRGPENQIRYCRSLDIKMEQRGYAAHRRERAESGRRRKWQEKDGSSFKSAVAYVSESVPSDEVITTIEAALKVRPLDFDNERKMAAERIGLRSVPKTDVDGE